MITGQKKWRKYFKGREVATNIVSHSSYVDIYDVATGKRKIGTLKNGEKIKVLNMTSYQPQYEIAYGMGFKKFGKVSENYVKKPLTKGGGPTENLRINASRLCAKGKKEKKSIGETKFDALVFNDKQSLQNSILSELKSNPNVPDYIHATFQDYFKKGMKKIIWHADTEYTEMNELGKYLGEILLGIFALDKNKSAFHPSPYKESEIKSFFVPKDPSFAGLDSMIQLKNGELVSISSKYGIGARASIFSNLLPGGVANFKNLKKSPFRDLCEIVIKNKINPEQGRKTIVYIYGIKHILKMKSGSSVQEIKDALMIYEDLRKQKLSKKTLEAIKKLANHEESAPEFTGKLPKSVTAFFNRTLAERLNNNKNAIEDIKKVLAGKNFWQANLDINKWREGQVYYRFTSSKKIDVKIIGNKSSIDDIMARYGWINYELKLK